MSLSHYEAVQMTIPLHFDQKAATAKIKFPSISFRRERKREGKGNAKLWDHMSADKPTRYGQEMRKTKHNQREKYNTLAKNTCNMVCGERGREEE